ncbi:hypothetical protein D3C81_1428100 [compost metagenome]
MVTVAVSPTVRSLSLRLMVAVGRSVSMAKLLESVVPTPALPDAALTTPLLSRVMTLVRS